MYNIYKNMSELTNYPDNYPSICIPKTFVNIKQETFIEKFNEYQLGEIDNISFVPYNKPGLEKFKKVYITFKKWNNHFTAIRARTRLINGKDIKIFYKDNWFWKIYKNKYDNTLLNNQNQNQIQLCSIINTNTNTNIIQENLNNCNGCPIHCIHPPSPDYTPPSTP